MAEILTVSRALGLTALALLLFVTGGVVYLSFMEASDRRRRRELEQSPDRQKR